MIKEIIKQLKRGQKIFSEDINSIINFVLLTFIYLVGVGFTSLFAKIMGKHFLKFKTEKSPSYWSNLKLNYKKEDYYKQF